MDNQKNLLNVDLDEVAEAGKKENKRNKKLLILGAVVAVILVVAIGAVSLHTRNANRETNYQTALSALESDDYDTAISLFQQLNDYKDSATLLETAEFAKEFTTSEVYAKFEKSTKAYIDTCLENGYANGSCSYNAKEKVVTISAQHSKEMDEGIDFDNFTPELLAAWIGMTTANDNLTKTVYTTFVEDDYPVDCQYILTDSTGEILYSAVNGQTTYTCLDVASMTEKMQEEVYSQIAVLVDSEQYQEAYNYWNSINANDTYTLSYKNLSDYYYYAEAMKDYHEEGTAIHQVLSALEKVSENFKNVKELRQLLSVPGELDGIYEKPYESEWLGVSEILVERIEIQGDNISLYWYRKDRNRVEGSYGRGTLLWQIENGVPTFVTAKCGIHKVEIQQNSNGLTVKWMTELYSQQEVDSYKSGAYTKVS